MTYEINFIPGNKRSICRNDCFSVVDTSRNDRPHVLAFIPVENAPALTKESIRAAFEAAHEYSANNRQIIETALHTLGVATSAPKAPAA